MIESLSRMMSTSNKSPLTKDDKSYLHINFPPSLSVVARLSAIVDNIVIETSFGACSLSSEAATLQEKRINRNTITEEEIMVFMAMNGLKFLRNINILDEKSKLKKNLIKN
jgi:hypothetical protein